MSLAHVSSIMAPMFNACPFCKAQPFEPCYNMHSLLKKPVKYTHNERNK